MNIYLLISQNIKKAHDRKVNWWVKTDPERTPTLDVPCVYPESPGKYNMLSELLGPTCIYWAPRTYRLFGRYHCRALKMWRNTWFMYLNVSTQSFTARKNASSILPLKLLQKHSNFTTPYNMISLESSIYHPRWDGEGAVSPVPVFSPVIKIQWQLQGEQGKIGWEGFKCGRIGLMDGLLLRGVGLGGGQSSHFRHFSLMIKLRW